MCSCVAARSPDRHVRGSWGLVRAPTRWPSLGASERSPAQAVAEAPGARPGPHTAVLYLEFVYFFFLPIIILKCVF